MWFEDRMMFIEAPKVVSTCRSKGPKCELLERTCDHVIASQSLEGEITYMEVVEDFESSLHKAVSSVIERGKEVQEWKEQKMPKVLALLVADCQGEVLLQRAEKRKRR